MSKRKDGAVYQYIGTGGYLVNLPADPSILVTEREIVRAGYSPDLVLSTGLYVVVPADPAPTTPPPATLIRAWEMPEPPAIVVSEPDPEPEPPAPAPAPELDPSAPAPADTVPAPDPEDPAPVDPAVEESVA